MWLNLSQKKKPTKTESSIFVLFSTFQQHTGTKGYFLQINLLLDRTRDSEIDNATNLKFLKFFVTWNGMSRTDIFRWLHWYFNYSSQQLKLWEAFISISEKPCPEPLPVDKHFEINPQVEALVFMVKLEQWCSEMI